MRILRALGIAFITAFIAMFAAVLVSEYLTKLYHVPEMEGQRGMMIIFFIAPLTFIGGFVIGLVTAAIVSSPGGRGFFKAQGLSILFVIALTSLVSAILYFAADKPPKIDGKFLALDFEVRVPSSIQISTDTNIYLNVSLYTDGTQTRVAQIKAIQKDSTGATLAGTLPILSHVKSRELFPSIANVEHGSQFIPVDLSAARRKEDETWSDWNSASRYADDTPASDADRMSARYRIRPIQR
jgi:MFS family permease